MGAPLTARGWPPLSRAGVRKTQERILARAKAQGISDQGEALFFQCHARMKSEPTVQSRLETFINLSGFCRNMSLALALSAIALAVGCVIGSAGTGSVVSHGWRILGSEHVEIGYEGRERDCGGRSGCCRQELGPVRRGLRSLWG
jgi:hypothetical protein